MEYVNLGNAGIKVSRICIGCMSFGNDVPWKVEMDQAKKLVKKAIDLGINFFDTSNNYSKGRSEEITGECLKGYRQDIVLASKVYMPTGEGPNESGLSRKHILKQISSSLKRLQTDHLDLYQIHRWDYNTPIEETLRTLDGLVRSGQTHYIGASSMYAWHFLKALNTSEKLSLETFVSMQCQYSLLFREEEREMIPLCQEKGIGLIVWSPMARGFLAGKYKRGETPQTPRYKTDPSLSQRLFRPADFTVTESVSEVAKRKGVTPAQVALAWLFHKGVTAPILGASKPDHIQEAVDAVNVKLESDEIVKIESGYAPQVVNDHH